MMRDAAKKLKEVVAKKDIVPLLMHYVANNGFMFASDSLISAGIKTDYTGPNFAVLGYAFNQFIDKTPGELKITVQDNHWVKVSSGRYRATIPGQPVPNVVVSNLIPKTEPIKIDETFLKRLRSVRPFLSENGTQDWASSAYIRDNALHATNNVVVVRTLNACKNKLPDISIPFEILDYALRNSEDILSMTYDPACVAFLWKDGSWVSSRLRVGNFPNTGTLFENLPKDMQVINKEWKEAYLHVSGLCGGEIKIFPDKITGGKDTLVEAEIECPFEFPEGREELGMSFNSQYFDPIISSATHMCFYVERGPRAAFKNENLTGLIAGMGA